MAMERENRPARGAGKRRKKVCQFCVDSFNENGITTGKIIKMEG